MRKYNRYVVIYRSKAADNEAYLYPVDETAELYDAMRLLQSKPT